VPRHTGPFPRYLAARLREALAVTPAVLIHGPRQSGKTTLARTAGEPRGFRYVSFDDEAVREAARRDPLGFVEHVFLLDRLPACMDQAMADPKEHVDTKQRLGRTVRASSSPPSAERPRTRPFFHHNASTRRTLACSKLNSRNLPTEVRSPRRSPKARKGETP